MLAAAAVAGREFDLPLLAAVTGTGRGELLDLLSAAVDLEMVDGVAGHPGRYRFTHALIRETIYAQLSPARRTELHRRFGDRLEERARGSIADCLPELAYHFFEASPAGGEDKAMAYAAADLAGSSRGLIVRRFAGCMSSRPPRRVLAEPCVKARVTP